MTLCTKPSNKQLNSSPGKLLILIVFAFLVLCSIKSKAGTHIVPGIPGPVTGQTNVCALVGTGHEAVYSIEAVADAEVYLWTVPPTVEIVRGQGTTSISIRFLTGFNASANKQIRVRAISQDGYSADRIFYLTSQQPGTPSAINGPTNACMYIGTSSQATYTTARDASATAYIWGANSGTTSIFHPNGSGPNDTIIKIVFKTGYKTAPITVQAVNNCGFSASRILNVSGAAPSTPGIITGPTNVCPYMLPNGTIATYSINPVPGALSYTWNAPDDCIIGHPNGAGSNDVMITVQYPADFAGGSISVIASSGCDDSNPRSLVVTKLNPGTPGIITAIQTIVCPNREYLYKLPSMPSNATSVNWTLPPDALSFSGQGTTALTVKYPEEPVSGVVSATGVNNCATSSTRQLLVRLGRCQLERTTARGRTGTESQKAAGDERIIVDAMQVNIAPNPSRENFKLQINTGNKENIFVKVLDLQGRELKKVNASAGQLIIFGSDYKPGTYILDVTQGKTRHTEKLLKL